MRCVYGIWALHAFHPLNAFFIYYANLHPFCLCFLLIMLLFLTATLADAALVFEDFKEHYFSFVSLYFSQMLLASLSETVILFVIFVSDR